MYTIAVIASVILMALSAADYVRRAWSGESRPVAATWVLMTVVMGLSLSMYWNSPHKSWTGNIGVVSGFAGIAVILGGVIAANIRYGTLRVAFDRLQKQCLLMGAVVTVFWAATDNPLVSYILVQCIAIIAYSATVRRLWDAERSTEPIFVWAASLGATLFAIYPAWVRDDLYSWIYLARSVPSLTIVVTLIMRARARGQTIIATT